MTREQKEPSGVWTHSFKWEGGAKGGDEGKERQVPHTQVSSHMQNIDLNLYICGGGSRNWRGGILRTAL